MQTEIQIGEDFDVEALRTRLRKMTDEQLEKFGRAAAIHGLPDSQHGQAASECFCHPTSGGQSGMAKKKPEEGRREFNVGDQVRVKLRTGETVSATIKAVITKTKSVRLQVDYGKDETALVYDWQVVEGR